MIFAFSSLFLALFLSPQEPAASKSHLALPPSPAKLPDGKVQGENGREAGRYRFDENKDALTDETTVSLRITLTAEHDAVVPGMAGQEAMIFFQHRQPGNSKAFYFLTIARATDETLGSKVLTSNYSIAFSPLGMEPVRIGARSRIESLNSGYHREVATIELKDPEQMVESLTSPLIRLARTDGRNTDYRLTETDKMAVLWVIENKVRGGEEAVARVRRRLSAAQTVP